MSSLPIIFALAAAFGALPAYAYHCPQMMQQLDTLIAQHPNLTPEQIQTSRNWKPKACSSISPGITAHP